MGFFVNLDLVGKEFNFKLPDGNERYKTCTGGFCSVILLIIMLIFAFATGLELKERKSYTIQKTEYDNVFGDSDFAFSSADGFAVAAAFFDDSLSADNIA